ncbi:MAG: aminoglycoside phosphotransferase family protein [Burkholderiaceae bacterium]|nr:aminoglycoside phosphotransferase family protein [Microbacteriaceae bacterium]
MAPPPAPSVDLLDDLLGTLREAIADVAPHWSTARLQPLADAGLAHHHVALEGTGVLARIPKQSQLQLDASANLAYQEACFTRAAASGHTPALTAVLAPRPGLPRGALLVEHIEGRAAELPRDLAAIATALARIHALPLPADRAPLWDHADPLAALDLEIRAQAAYLDEARIDPTARALIEGELARLAELVSAPDRPERHLIAFDAHPGNFVIRPDGRAVLVDLEKCRYSYPALDLAHATLYTSTTWEPGATTTLGPEEVSEFQSGWERMFRQAGGADPASNWHLPLRRAMWLWSATWSAKWSVLSDRERAESPDGEDWSAGNSTDALTVHVRERVGHYLDAATVAGILRGLGELDGA